jgi:hypothetical protein
MLLEARNIARAVLVTARPVLQRALALWAAIGVVAAVLFGSNGMQARDLTHLFHRSAGARIALGMTWIVLVTPVVSGAFDAPGTRTLRSLPVRSRAWRGPLLALMLLVQLPCGVLFARGDGPLTGGVMMLLAASIEAALVATLGRVRYALVAFAAMALVILDARPLFVALPAAGLALIAVAAAWKVALDGAGLDVRMTRPTVPVLAITAAHLLRMVRVARARLAVATAGASLGALALTMSLNNDPPLRPVARALTVLSLPLTLCAAVLVGPVRETENHVRSLGRVTHTRWTTLAAAFALALVAPSSALGATAGVFAGTLAHARALALGGAAGAWAIPIAGAVALWARWHDRRTRQRPVLFVLGVLAVAALALGAAAAW